MKKKKLITTFISIFALCISISFLQQSPSYANGATTSHTIVGNWENAGFNEEIEVKILYNDGEDLFVAITTSFKADWDAKGVHKLDGSYWKFVDKSSLPNSGMGTAEELLKVGNTLYFATTKGIYINSGNGWVLDDGDGLVDYAYALAVYAGRIYVATISSDIFKKNTGGWVNAGEIPGPNGARKLFVKDGELYAGAYGVWKYSSSTWNPVDENTLPDNGAIFDFAYDDEYFYACGNRGVFKNSGDGWEKVGADSWPETASAKSISLKDGLIYVSTIGTWAHVGGVGSPYNPGQNIRMGTKYVKMLLNQFNGNLILALAAYNAGPGAVQKFRQVPPYRETRRYIPKVLRYYRKYKRIIKVS